MQWTSVVHAFGSQTSVESFSQPLQISFQDAVCTRTPEQNFIRVNKILEARRLVVEASWICCSGAGRDSSVGTAGLDAALRHLDGRLDQVQFSHGLNPGRGPRFPDRLFNLQSSGPFVQVSFQRGHNEGSQPSLHAKIWFCQPCIASGPSIVAGGQGCCEAPSAPYGVAASVFAKRAKQPTKLVPKVLSQLCAFCIFPDGSACRSSHQAGCVWAVDS